MKEIKFYKVNEPFGFFSNFSRHPIFIDGEVWATVEHFFQANKFKDAQVRKKIKSFESPLEAANEGRDKRHVIRADWEIIKEKIMLRGLIAKFLQHTELKTQILNTKDALIIENTINDSFWGNGPDGNGKNRLGKLLEEVRLIIRDISKDPDLVLPPWIAFPNVSQFDLFWRMGIGEDYLTQWSKYYLGCHDKVKYIEEYPVNNDWDGIYE